MDTMVAKQFHSQDIVGVDHHKGSKLPTLHGLDGEHTD